LIFAPEKTEKGVIGFLKRALPFLIIIALSIRAGFFIQYMVMLYGRPPYELPIDHTYIPLYAFMTGVIFAIIAFIVIERFIKTIRKQTQ